MDKVYVQAAEDAEKLIPAKEQELLNIRVKLDSEIWELNCLRTIVKYARTRSHPTRKLGNQMGRETNR